EALREREVLLQEPVALERAARVGQKRLGLGEPDRPYRRPGQVLAPRLRAAFRANEHAPGVPEELLVDAARNALGALQVEAQPIERQLRERQTRGRLEVQPNAGADLVEALNADRRKRAGAAVILRVRQLDRPKDQLLPGAVLARGPLAAGQHGVARQREAFGERRLAEH